MTLADRLNRVAAALHRGWHRLPFARHGRERAEKRGRHGRGRFGLAGRLFVLIVVVLVIAQVVSLGIYVRDRANATLMIFRDSVIERVVTAVDLLEEVPAGERRALVRAIRSPTLWILTGRQTRRLMHPPWEPSRYRFHLARPLVEKLAPRRVEVLSTGHWRHRHHAGPPDMPELLPSRHKIAFLVRLNDGYPVAFIASSDVTSLRWAARVAGGATLLLLVTLVIAFGASRWLLRPLRRVSAAVDAFGVDQQAPPAPEAGSRDVRALARAFNRMRERIQANIAERNMMLGAVSHDLRTALARLRLRLELIDDETERERAARDLNDMLALLEDTLAFARDDANRAEREPQDLAALTETLCDDLADNGAAVQCESRARPVVRCNAAAIRRALGNLLDNALRYAGSAEVAVDALDGDALITIADRGPGIDPAWQERLFEPFVRGEGSRSRETGGSGLGLAVARQMIRAHGGDITLENRSEGGLIVRIRLPRTQ